MDTYLRTVITTYHRTVINQSYSATQTGCRHSGTHPGYTGSHDYKIIFAGNRCFIRQSQCLTTECFQLLYIRRRHLACFRSKVDRITTTVKSRQIMQLDYCFQILDRYLSSYLPHPGRTLRSQWRSHLLSSDRQTEFTGTFPFFPWGSPVIGPNIYIIFSFFWKRDFRRCIIDGYTHPMRQKVRRPHQIHKLLVNLPTSFVTKTFGFDKKVCRSDTSQT